MTQEEVLVVSPTLDLLHALLRSGCQSEIKTLRTTPLVFLLCIVVGVFVYDYALVGRVWSEYLFNSAHCN
jgi:hypothetical protein